MRYLTLVFVTILSGVMGAGAGAQSLAELNEEMFQQMRDVRGVSNAEIQRIRRIFEGSSYIGQGNPAVTRHPMTPEEAAARLGGSVAQVQASYRNARFERICGGPYMVPLYDPATESPEDATTCVDMFEYPNIPMVYPVVWVRANEAHHAGGQQDRVSQLARGLILGRRGPRRRVQQDGAHDSAQIAALARAIVFKHGRDTRDIVRRRVRHHQMLDHLT